MRKILLIGGAPGTGKTTFTKKVAAHIGVPWISTDQIRTILRSAQPEQVPETDGDFIASEVARYERVWSGVLALIRAIDPWEDCIIEGSAILPQFVARDCSANKEVTAVFLTFETREEIQKVIEDRSKLPWINTKTPEQQALKVEQTYALKEKIRADASSFGFKLVSQSAAEDPGFFQSL